MVDFPLATFFPKVSCLVDITEEILLAKKGC